MSERVGPGPPCWNCGGDYGEHSSDCPINLKRQEPRRFRIRCQGKHANGSDSPYRYGCYFPLTDLVVGDMGGRGTGEPQDVEWLDKQESS